ncbi:tol-pal system protein YbgF [Porticoccaceae bacterium LTM1]|nr:tol-pal system protein YbgF [Porticoccaceae bacterium LTM1]
MKYRLMLLLLGAAVSNAALASSRAPVEELEVATEKAKPANQAANQQAGELYYQMQVLQEEVRQLRGMIEEMSYEMKQLKQRQMDDYMDLDRRISGSAQSSGNPQSVGQNAGVPAGNASALLPVSSDAEKNHYSNAYQLLRDKHWDKAVAAFNEHIQQYPNGQYTSNAHYWLGEVYLSKAELEKSRDSFAMVVNNFPTSRKAPDAAYKLATVYHQLGDAAKARELLEKVAAGNSKAAQLAKQYLQDSL